MDISNQLMIDNVPNTLNSATSTSKIDSAIPEFNIYTNVGMSLLWVMGLIMVLGWLLKRSRFNRSIIIPLMLKNALSSLKLIINY